jgi:hypothetical protein
MTEKQSLKALKPGNSKTCPLLTIQGELLPALLATITVLSLLIMIVCSLRILQMSITNGGKMF